VGASIAVNGVCLTVSQLTSSGFVADISGETYERTALGNQRSRARVNLELPLSLEASLDGHIVLGHVDTIGEIHVLLPCSVCSLSSGEGISGD